jgi:dTDP-4-dehydrorhamnose 3,5-epimerase
MIQPFLIYAEPFVDSRGTFSKIYKQLIVVPSLIDQIVEANIAESSFAGTLRGLHYQIGKEMKFVKVLDGVVYNVTVDIRRGSPTFLKLFIYILLRNDQTLCIPPGFANGYMTLTPHCRLLYLHTEPYSEKNSRTIRYDDPALGINWPLSVTRISDKDKNAPLLKKFKGV